MRNVIQMFDIIVHMCNNQKMRKKRIAENSTDNTKDRLIQASKSLFARKGFDGVTVREIAEKAGVNFSLIRHYFGDKKGLYCACLELYGKTRLASALRILEPVQSSEEFKVRLKLIIQEIIDSLMLDPELSRMTLREIESEDPIATEIIRDTFGQMAQAFVQFFGSAQKLKIISKDIQPVFLTQIIQLTLNHMVLADRVRGKVFNMSLKIPENRLILTENLHAMILHGVLLNKNDA